MYRAEVVLDSISPAGHRLTTLEVEFPRFILAEMNTHRMFSRNSASSRAIPIEKQLAKLDADPFIPEYWGAAQKGMAADHEVSDELKQASIDLWLQTLRGNVRVVQAMAKAGLHKQIPNRLLEPFMWHTAIISATEWDNFFALRISPHAQPEIRTIALKMRAALETSIPLERDWHMPYLQPGEREELTLGNAQKVSAGRCARVSYLTQGGHTDPVADIALADRLLGNGHMSPFEHVAEAQGEKHDSYEVQWSGNFYGWTQYRKTLPHEHNFGDHYV